jgi:hypothetical protein
LSLPKVALPISIVLLSLAAASFCYLTGILNLHYDGVAHLNIARRVFDHPVPHYSHLGTVWLPLQHLLLLPWVQNDVLWSRGLAGTLVSVSAFWFACYYLFQLSTSPYRPEAAFLSVIAFAINPNILYLQATPLGEMLYIALFLAVAFHLLRLAEQPGASVLPCAACTLLASLARYDGWLLPVWGTCVLLLVGLKRHEPWRVYVPRAATYLLVASLGIVGWLVYNWIAFDDPFSFARGEHSTQRNITRIVAEAGLSNYPPYRNLSNACLYYGQAALLTAGPPLMALGTLGFVFCAWCQFRTPKFWILGFVFLFPPVFYVTNMLMGTGIIYVPRLPPYGILNVRYAGLFLPGLGLFAPAGIQYFSKGLRLLAGALWAKSGSVFHAGRIEQGLSLLFVAVLLVFWFLHAPPRESFAFYQEARVNGFERKQADFAAAGFLKANYDGKPILMDVGQHGIIPQRCSIPLVRIVDEATSWQTALARPSLFVSWIVVQEGDGVSRFPVNWIDVQERFEVVFQTEGPFEKPLRIYRKRQ